MTVLEKTTEILNASEICTTLTENGFTYNPQTDRIEFYYINNANRRKAQIYLTTETETRRGNTKEFHMLKCFHYTIKGSGVKCLNGNHENAEYIANIIIESFKSKHNRKALQNAKANEKPYMIIYTENGNEKERFLHALSTMDALRIFTQDLCMSNSYTMEFKSIIEL